MASDKEGGVAAEGETASTYLYRIEGGWDDFSLLIDRALEAAAFQREAILLPEDKLALPEHITDAMLVKRTPAIARLRRCFAGRAIHSSFDRWLQDVEKCRSSLAQASKGADPEQEQKTKYCTGCGAKLTPGAKFCGQCGTPHPGNLLAAVLYHVHYRDCRHRVPCADDHRHYQCEQRRNETAAGHRRDQYFEVARCPVS